MKIILSFIILFLLSCNDTGIEEDMMKPKTKSADVKWN